MLQIKNYQKLFRTGTEVGTNKGKILKKRHLMAINRKRIVTAESRLPSTGQPFSTKFQSKDKKKQTVE